jgi:nucleoside diphosphate kinase
MATLINTKPMMDEILLQKKRKIRDKFTQSKTKIFFKYLKKIFFSLQIVFAIWKNNLEVWVTLKKLWVTKTCCQQCSVSTFSDNFTYVNVVEIPLKLVE